MALRDYDDTLTDSAMDALSPMNVLKRIFLFLVFGILLGLKELISNLDAAGASGGGWLYLSAILGAVRHGVVIALGSMWIVLTQPTQYFQANSYGSIAFAVFSLVMLVAFFYQPVSLVVNIFDGQRGQATGKILRIFVTLIIVVLLSCIVYYLGGQQTIVSTLSNLTDVANQTLQNATQGLGNVTVVNLL